MTFLSGAQATISADGYVAEIASIGATLRTLRYRERNLVLPFGADEVRPFYAGATLAPWPNRIVDGRYSFDGNDYRVDLTEPERGHALHGFATWLDFAIVEQSGSAVTLAATIPPRTGYPFSIAVRVEFALDARGLATRVTGSNIGTARSPWGTGPHPYLLAGSGTTDDWHLELSADAVLAVDGRLSPEAVEPVSGDFDLRAGRSLSGVVLDHAFTALSRDANGAAVARLVDAHGVGVEVRWGADCGWVQVFTGDLPDPSLFRRAVAIEPMTCPPDAFNSGVDLIVLDPGGSATASWLITAV